MPRADRRKLLFLSQDLPYPPNGGARIRTFNVIKQLAHEYDITLLSFVREKEVYEVRDLEAAKGALSQYGRVWATPLPQSVSGARFGYDHVAPLLTRSVYTRYVFRSRAFKRRLLHVLRHFDPALIHSDSIDLSGYFRHVGSTPIVCTHHDVQSLLLERRAAREGSRLKRWYVGAQARAMRREEVKWCPRVDLNVTVSEADRSRLSAIAPGGRYSVVENGVDVEYFHPREGPTEGIVFVGGTSWFPNKDALTYFGSQILPLIRRHVPGVKVRWVGRAREEEKRAAWERFGIEMTGFVEDVRPYVWAGRCVVVPIRVGGGTRVKILDAWAMGKPIVSTGIGCEGLEVEDGRDMEVADEPKHFAEAVVAVLQDEGRARRLGTEGRRKAVERYSWDQIGRRMRETYDRLISGERPAPLESRVP